MAKGSAALSRAPKYLVLLAVLCWVLIPLYFLVATSLTPENSTLHGLKPPSGLTLTNYRAIFRSGTSSIWTPLRISAIVTAATTVLALLLAVPAAYALSRMRSRRLGRGLYLSFFVLRGIPPIALVLPFYVIFSKAHLLNNVGGLIIALTPLALPYCVWVLRTVFDSIPPAMEEAASIDGAGTVRRFWSIVLPVAVPGIAAAGVLGALFVYVDYMIVATLAGPDTFTFPIYITSFQEDFVSLVGPLAAASLIGAIPMLILFAFSQRYMRRLATAGIH
jgi:multiple sugar transport system permease protein